MGALRTIIVTGCAAEQFGRLALALEDQQVGAPTLLVAEIADDALLLGRHQRAASAIDAGGARARGLAVARRAGGGKAVRVAPGTVGVLLAVPPGGWTEALSPDKVLNRCVRGLLGGLPSAGATGGAFYFGRDFVVWQRQQIAVVSQDGNAGGTKLFEALVATEAPLALPASLSRRPEHDDPRAGGPPHACLSTAWAAAGRRRGFEEIARALVAGYARLLGATPMPEPDAPAPGPPLAPPVDEDEAGFVASGPVQVPIGFIEALVRREGDRIGEARLRGDLIAPAFAVVDLEASLSGRPFTLEAIGPLVDAAFTRREATLIGLRELRVIAESFVACRPNAGGP
jgi:hypothetical protein